MLSEIQSELNPREYLELNYTEVTKQIHSFVEGLEFATEVEHSEQYEMADTGSNVLCELLFDGHAKPCSTTLIIVGDVTKQKPTTLMSGAIHGDERLGPNVVLHILEILQKYQGHPYIQFLLNTRTLLLSPFANAYGYCWDQREDYNGVDPNRDFPFDGERKKCLSSPTARFIASIYATYQVHLTVTWHGGMRVLSYGWGNYAYLDSKGKSMKTPDNIGYYELAKRLQMGAGRAVPAILPAKPVEGLSVEQTEWFYPIGTITDTVYPLRGGMEDWTYSGGWQCTIKDEACHVETECKVPVSARPKSLTFLVEADDHKRIANTDYGQGMDYADEERRLHMARNSALGFVAYEATGPSVLFELPSALSATDDASRISFVAMGCTKLTSLVLVQLEATTSAECDSKALEWRHTWDADDTGFLADSYLEEEKKFALSMIVTFEESFLRRRENVDLPWFEPIGVTIDGNKEGRMGLVCGSFPQFLTSYNDLPSHDVVLEEDEISACFIPIYKSDEHFAHLPQDIGMVAPLVEPQSLLAQHIKVRSWRYGVGPQGLPFFLTAVIDKNAHATLDPYLPLYGLVLGLLSLLCITRYKMRIQLAFLWERISSLWHKNN